MIRSGAIEELSSALGQRGQDDEQVESARSDTESVERLVSNAFRTIHEEIRPAS
jgi:hypothetical protein